jgi:DNA-binding NtrC family response regulator
MERAIVLNKTGNISESDFPEPIARSQKAVVEYNAENGLMGAVEEYERHLILSELQKNKGNKAKTANRFKVHRSTFMSKLKKYNIN